LHRIPDPDHEHPVPVVATFVHGRGLHLALISLRPSSVDHRGPIQGLPDASVCWGPARPAAERAQSLPSLIPAPLPV
jgi:hypothetical protein